MKENLEILLASINILLENTYKLEDCVKINKRNKDGGFEKTDI